MSAALTRIEEYFRAYCQGVERCRSAKSGGYYIREDYEDAYERLVRLLNRYNKEKRKLNKFEREALVNTFEDNVFIQSLRIYRVIGSHMQSDVAQKKGGILEIRDISGAPIELSAQTSALEFFAGHVANVHTPTGNQRIYHLAHLEEAEKLIAKAIGLAGAARRTRRERL